MMMMVLYFDISDLPEAHLKLGASLSGDHIKEGSDVYFDCIIDANPPVSKVNWRLNVSLFGNVNEKVRLLGLALSLDRQASSYFSGSSKYLYTEWLPSYLRLQFLF